MLADEPGPSYHENPQAPTADPIAAARLPLRMRRGSESDAAPPGVIQLCAPGNRERVLSDASGRQCRRSHPSEPHNPAGERFGDDSFVGVSCRPAGVLVMEFSRELRNDVLGGRHHALGSTVEAATGQAGGRYRVGPGEIEVDAIKLVPFAAVTGADVRRAGEPDRETMRQRAAHAEPIDEDTLAYRIEFHAVSRGD